MEKGKKKTQGINTRSSSLLASIFVLSFIFLLFFFLVPVANAECADTCSDCTNRWDCLTIGPDNCVWRAPHGEEWGNYCYEDTGTPPGPAPDECTSVPFEWGDLEADVSADGNTLRVYNSSDWAFKTERTIINCPPPEFNEPAYHQPENADSVQYDVSNDGRGWIGIDYEEWRKDPGFSCDSEGSQCSYDCCQNAYDLDFKANISSVPAGHQSVTVKVSGKYPDHSNWSYQTSISFTKCLCTPGEKKCQDDDVYICASSCLQWNLNQDCGDGYWTSEYRCDGSMRQRKYIDQGCDSAACYNHEIWFDFEECGSDYCTEWTVCGCNGDFIQECRTCYEQGCESGSCYSNSTDETRDSTDCNTNDGCLDPPNDDTYRDYYCSAGSCKYTDYPDDPRCNQSPTVSCDDEYWIYCSDSRNPFLPWTYSDNEGDPQESYQLQIDNNSDFNSPEIDTGEVFSSSTTYHPAGAILEWDTGYYWRIKAKDDQGGWSDWSVCSFDTIIHAYPDIDFNWFPENPSALELVQFTDNSTCYDDDINGSDCTSSNDSFQWSIDKTTEGDPVVKWGEQVQATFSEPGIWDAVLEVTDSDGFTCPLTKPVNVSYPLPEWEEVIPK